MILDSLKNSSVYAGEDDRLAMAFDFLAETDFASFPDGKVELKGDEVFAIVQSYDSRLLEESNGKLTENISTYNLSSMELN